MTDVETRLRGVFADDAATTPDADLLALAGTVRGTVRRERRRRASVAGALVVLGVAAGLLVVPRVLPATVTTPASQAGPASPSASSRPVSPGAEEPALRWRGVVVPVPASYLSPDAVRCGVAVADAAYVDRPGAAVRACLERPEHPERLTTVVLMPSDRSPGNSRRYAEPESVLADGRTQLTTAVPGAPVRIVVTAPDPALARRLFAGLRIESDLAGCALKASGSPPDRVEGAAGTPVPQGPAVSVCSYTDGWLDSWRRLSPAETGDLVTALTAPLPRGPQRVTICDALGGRAWLTDHWVVTWADGGTDGPLRLWVSAGPCVRAGVHFPDGGLRPLTPTLVERLYGWAPGISATFDVAGDPKS